MTNTTTNTAATKTRKLDTLQAYYQRTLAAAVHATISKDISLADYTDKELVKIARSLAYERNSGIFRNIANALTN